MYEWFRLLVSNLEPTDYDFLLQEILNTTEENVKAVEAMRVMITAAPEGSSLYARFANNRRELFLYVNEAIIRTYAKSFAGDTFRQLCFDIELNHANTPGKGQEISP